MTSITSRLTDAVRKALGDAGLPQPEDCQWEVPRQPEHGDYATNAAMALAKAARRAPRQIAELIVRHFPPVPEVARLEVAGPGFLNVFLSPAWYAAAVRTVLETGPAYGRGDSLGGQRVHLEFVSANPTGPLVIVNARAAAVGDALARILRAQGAAVTTEYYVNDAGTQFEALARSFRARLHEAHNRRDPDRRPLPVAFPENGYPGEYLVELAEAYLDEGQPVQLTPADDAAETERLGRWAVERIVEAQRRVLAAYGAEFDLWTSEQRDVRDRRLPEQALEELARRGLTHAHEGALWFQSPEFGDDKDRVLRRSTGELTYFGVDLAHHHALKFPGADRVIDFFGPDHHGYVARLRAAMQALGHPPEQFEVMIIQLVTLLRDGEPVRMSKRRGEFVLMEELLEEVGRDAARFTFLTRRHDSPLEFDLAVATRQSADNPVYYAQYAHARIRSIARQAAEQGITPHAGGDVDLSPLTAPEERELMKRLSQYPELLAGAARAREPHRVAYFLQELAGVFHPYYRAHRVIRPDEPLMHARLALCAAVGQVIANGLALLGVSAPETM
jgi:arginyl-tRNA synthetase